MCHLANCLNIISLWTNPSHFGKNRYTNFYETNKSSFASIFSYVISKGLMSFYLRRERIIIFQKLSLGKGLKKKDQHFFTGVICFFIIKKAIWLFAGFEFLVNILSIFVKSTVNLKLIVSESGYEGSHWPGCTRCNWVGSIVLGPVFHRRVDDNENPWNRISF